MTIYFENLTIGLYVLDIYIKFRTNWMIFTIQFINLIFMHNFIL